MRCRGTITVSQLLIQSSNPGRPTYSLRPIRIFGLPIKPDGTKRPDISLLPKILEGREHLTVTIEVTWSQTQAKLSLLQYTPVVEDKWVDRDRDPLTLIVGDKVGRSPFLGVLIWTD